ADLVFAGGVVVAASTLAAAALRRGPTWALAAAAALESCAAVAVWVGFALRHERPLAVAAGGLTACALVAAASILLRHALRRIEAVDAGLEEARAELVAVVTRERDERAAELERTLARAR